MLRTSRRDIQIYKILVITKGLRMTVMFKIMWSKYNKSLPQIAIKECQEMLEASQETKILPGQLQEIKVTDFILQEIQLDLTLIKYQMVG
jgi:hypothetical protein